MSETVHVLCENGETIIEMELPLHEAIADRLAKGYLKLVDASGTPHREDRTMPPPYGSKRDWVSWAVHISATTDSPLSPEDAEAFTKQDLIELYGR